MAQRIDPYTDFRFLVEIEGVAQAGFAECDGLVSEVEVIEYREGGDISSVRKIPGLTKYSNITLKRGLTNSRDLYDWHLSAIRGNVERKNGSIIVLDDAGREAVRWNFSNGWPSKYEGPSLNAKGNTVAIETFTITIESLERA